MHETVDECYDASGVGEDLIPFAEGFVGCQHEWTAQLIAARDDLEEQIRVASVVGEVSDLIALRYA